MGGAIDGATLATTVSIALYGGDTVDVTGTTHVANDNVRIAGDISGGRRAKFAVVRADITLPAATIDITAGAALDVGRRAGSETVGVVCGTFRIVVIGAHSEDIVHGTRRTGGIDILRDRAAEQRDIGVAIDITAACL